MRGLAVERYLGLNVVILFSSVDCGVARWPAILAFAAYPVEMIEHRFGPSGLLPLGRSASSMRQCSYLTTAEEILTRVRNRRGFT